MRLLSVIGIALGAMLPLHAAVDTSFIQPGQSILPPFALGADIALANHPLSRQINAFLIEQKKASAIIPTGLTKENYLEYLKGQVHCFMPGQFPSGQIGESYATGGYVLAAAVLYASGYDRDTAVLSSAMKAMDFSVDFLMESLDTMRAWRKNPVGANPMPYSDFMTAPIMLAYEQLGPFVPKARYDVWKAKLLKFTPEGYSLYKTAANNWPLVQIGGEFLRIKNGMTDTSYVEWVLQSQKNHFTNFGMFMEAGAPFAYDGFSRYFLTGILNRGYHGQNFDFYRDACWKGAWTSLMCQSPHGESPTGYRSAHHVWNEGEMAVIDEIFAAQYAKSGRLAEAGAFKRAARLALKSMLRWIRPDGSAYIVKNRYPALNQPHAANPHSVYSLLAAHMAAVAYLIANDSIAEKPAPADVGGFAFHIPEFNMAFAHAGGTYIEYMTRGNHAYNGNPSGLLRIHLRNGNPQLGPSDGVVDVDVANGIHDMNVGPAWTGTGGKEIRLAEFPDTSYYRVSEAKPAEPPQATIKVVKETSTEANITATYDWNSMHIVEDLTLNDSGLTGKTTVTGGGVSALRAYYPMLIFDGTDSVDVRLLASAVSMKLRGDSVRYEILAPNSMTLKRSTFTKMSWNGLVQPLYADIPGTTYTYRVSAPRKASVGLLPKTTESKALRKNRLRGVGNKIVLESSSAGSEAALYWADGKRARPIKPAL